MGDEVKPAARQAPEGSSREHTKKISRESIVAATGRSRQEWFTLLDEAGAATWDHARIMRWLGAKRDIDSGWTKAVCAAYEESRAIKNTPDQPHASVSVSKTLRVAPDVLWPHLIDEDLRRDWLDMELDVQRHTPVTLFIDGGDGSILTLSISVLPATVNAEPRTRVSIRHTEIHPDAVDETRAFWRNALDSLSQQF